MATTLRVMTAPGVLKGRDLQPATQPSSVFSAQNPPYLIPPGESLLDGVKAGVPRYNATVYSASKDVAVALAAMEAAISTPGYAVFPGDGWYISALGLVQGAGWYGYQNGNRKIMGWIGDHIDSFGNWKTSIEIRPNAIPSDARAESLNPSNMGSPVTLYGAFFSGTNQTVPIPHFFAGIHFKGNFQTPYGASGTSGITVNIGVPGPIPWRGLALNKPVAGTRIQFCKFSGFAYTQKNSPPWELSGLETNYDNGTTLHCVEIDGRLPTGEVSAGGYMPNYTSLLTLENVWIHHTRRSGFAIHEHGGGDGGVYNISNVQIEAISSTPDGFAGNGLNQFPSSNVEEATGTLNYTNCRFAAGGGYHITLATTNGGGIADAINITDCVSMNPTLYNGCIVVRVVKQPNGAGINPYWTLANNSGVGALPINAKWHGTPLTAVASTQYNATIHKPDKYFIVVNN